MLASQTNGIQDVLLLLLEFGLCKQRLVTDSACDSFCVAIGFSRKFDKKSGFAHFPDPNRRAMDVAQKKTSVGRLKDVQCRSNGFFFNEFHSAFCPPKAGFPVAVTASKQAAASKSADTGVIDTRQHLAGPGVGGLNDTVLQSSCSEPGFQWRTWMSI